MFWVFEQPSTEWTLEDCNKKKKQIRIQDRSSINLFVKYSVKLMVYKNVILIIWYANFILCVSLQKFNISCFRHEHHYSETSKPEDIDHLLPEELVQSESSQSSLAERDWNSILQKVINLWFAFVINVSPFGCILQCVEHWYSLWIYLKHLSLENKHLPSD